MHGFCTVFARFQGMQWALWLAKYDKGCRNCRAENHDALHKNDVNSKLLKSECSARWTLLIRGPGIRVPSSAPKKNPRLTVKKRGANRGLFCFYMLKMGRKMRQKRDKSGKILGNRTSLAGARTRQPFLMWTHKRPVGYIVMMKILQEGIKRALPPWNTRWSALKFWLAEESQRWEHFGGAESALINRLCMLDLHSWNRATPTLCGKFCIAILRWYVNWKIGRTVRKLHLYTICCHLYRFG